MLERYFVRPSTVDRIRATWLGESIERYVTWLAEQDYSARCVHLPVANGRHSESDLTPSFPA
jgi:hypothetical protein